MSGLWEAFSNMMYAAVSVGARIGNKPAFVPRNSGNVYEVWGRSVTRLALISALLPIPIVAIGAILGWSTIVAWIGVFWMIWTAIFGLTTFLPIVPPAALVDLLFRGTTPTVPGTSPGTRTEGSEERWLVTKFWRFFFWVFLAEATVAQYISVFKLAKSPSIVPLAILAALALAMVAGINRKGATFRKLATFFAAMVLIICTLVFAAPKGSPVLDNFKSGVSRGSERILGGIGHAASLDWLDTKNEKPAGALAQYPFCAGAEKGKLEVKNENATYYLDDLHPDCWSERISLPPGISFRIEPDVPGSIEYWFWNGTRALAHKDQPLWMGDIPHSIFRLRADGPASLIIEVPDEEPEEDALEDENG